MDGEGDAARVPLVRPADDDRDDDDDDEARGRWG